jgi:hypothetical protein
MSNKDSNVRIAEEERLQAAVSRVEEEVSLFKKWLASESCRYPGDPKSMSDATRASQQPQITTPIKVASALGVGSTQLLERIDSRLKWGGLIAVVVILFAALAVVVTGYRNTQTILQQIALNDLQVTEPADGASVGDGQTIRGNTPYPGLNHYVVLTDVKTGHVSIQPARVSSVGLFAAEMTLNNEGADDVKQPEEISLRVMATEEQLGTGTIVAFPGDAKLSRHIRLLLKPADRIVISSPAEGATVGLFEQVIGTSRVADVKHYVLVKPVRSGTAYIQEQPVAHNNGKLTGRAQFGTASFGIGEQFTVEIIATSTTLNPGVLSNRPADAVTSKPVSVSRR